jgi:hypothetical protein
MPFPRAGLFARGSSTAFDSVVEWLCCLFAELPSECPELEPRDPQTRMGPVLERSWLTWLAPLLLLACHGKAVDSNPEQRETGPVDSDEPDSPSDDCDWYPQGMLGYSVDVVSELIEIDSPDLGQRWTLEDQLTGSVIGHTVADPGQWRLIVSTSDGACSVSALEDLSSCETVTFPTVEELKGTFGAAGENCRMPY